ncbi:MarR family transcriptional regulator [Sphingobium sp.]|uniref:MarR family winged helix-turn-helix transcriptional regulator n=1 Tax=Sphingobium sp. TaxID=1912891 RepID=UPI0028BD884E|nr:MarR family transcriptional regulator [Sphingobium sp.]
MKTKTKPANFSYRTWPFYWLSRASGRYKERMEQLLRPTGLDMPRWRVLMTLHQDRVAIVSEIAAHSGAKLPTMTKIIQRMEADGLVKRQPRAGKEWIMEVVLTDRGAAAGKEAWQRADRLYGEAFAGMSEKEIETLSGLLNKVADNLHAVSE